MKILAHARAYSELLAALPTLGITLAEGQSLQDALKARLESAAAQPPASAFEQQAVALLTSAGLVVAQGQSAADAVKAYAAQLEQGAADLSAAQASLTSVHTALAKAGVKFAPDAKPADIDAAIAARVSTRAAEQLAQTGTPQVETAPAAGAGSAAAKPQSGLARTQAAYEAKYKASGGTKV